MTAILTIAKRARRTVRGLIELAELAGTTSHTKAEAATSPPPGTAEAGVTDVGEVARELVWEGEYAQAEALLWRALVPSPRAPQATYLLGVALLMQGRYPDARRVIERAYGLKLRLPDSLTERVQGSELYDRLEAASKAMPDWVWPKYQLQRVRFHSIDCTLPRAIDHLVMQSSDPVGFVQVGANDGRGDPLVDAIAKHRLHGLFVEPQPKPFQRLREMYVGRSELSFENSAITKDGGTVTMYTADDRDTLGSLLPERNLLGSKTKASGNSFEVPSLTFDDAMKKHGIATFQVLQCDTEGYDYHVLSQVDLDQYQVNVVNIEFYLLPIEERLQTYELLNRYGFAGFFGRMDLLAVRQETFQDVFCLTERVATGS